MDNDHDLLTVALGFFFQPNISIGTAAQLPAFDPDLGLPAVLTLAGSMGGSLRSDFGSSDPCQLNKVSHAAVSPEVMAILVSRIEERGVNV
jgi:hypothetical protein